MFGGVWARWSEGTVAARQDTPGEKKKRRGMGWDGMGWNQYMSNCRGSCSRAVRITDPLGKGRRVSIVWDDNLLLEMG